MLLAALFSAAGGARAQLAPGASVGATPEPRVTWPLDLAQGAARASRRTLYSASARLARPTAFGGVVSVPVFLSPDALWGRGRRVIAGALTADALRAVRVTVRAGATSTRTRPSRNWGSAPTCGAGSGRVRSRRRRPPTPDSSTTSTRCQVEIRSRAALVDAVLASASQPAIMRPPTIGGVRYCDGGVRETAPIRVVVDNGATDVVAVVLSPEPDGSPVPLGAGRLATASRANDLLLTEIVRDDIVEAQSAGAARIALERPHDDVIADALEFTRADMRRMVRLGLERVDELFPDAPPFVA